ncbi:ABC transporter permease [Actinomadura spongiicola]|uniref:ABC transporter permease n=1 Tax=Actinomadura spongiicola TaxID=2303421 RepID=A0A372GN29_9ACTN|nr:ABC transporter permease [Actinomadura spongiicola]RFS86463.1 ABC transporter permease [Actinomadura spongiicola]
MGNDARIGVLTLALRTVRARWTAFTGTFIALTLGVAMTAALGSALASAIGTEPVKAPERYPRAVSVVQPVPPPDPPDTPAPPPGLGPDVVARVSGLGPVVADRVFYAQPATGDGPVIGRAWPSARYAAYQITAGRAPSGDREIVVAGGGGARPGTSITVLTGGGPGTYRVAGVAHGPEPAIFFTGTEAARLSPRVDVLISAAPVPAVRDAAGTGALVAPGAGLRSGPDDDRLADAEVLLGIAGGVAGFVAVFVVASTFAFAVAQRRRELALLRAVGMTARQLRRMLLGEAAVLGVAASLPGCALGVAAAPALGAWLTARDLAPPGYEVTPSVWPLAVACGTGLTVALLGVWAASRRAGRIRPVEAMRESVLEHRVMTLARWLAGLAITGTALWMLVATALNSPQAATNRKQYVLVTLLLIGGMGLLAPAVVPPVARLVTWPLGRFGRPWTTIVRRGALAAARRTASTAAPVLITLGLTVGLLGATAMVKDARAAEERARHGGDLAVVPVGAPGLTRAAVARVEAVPGVRAVPRTPTTITVRQDGEPVTYAAEAVPPGGPLSALPVLAGTPSALTDDSIIVGREWERRVGDRVDVRLADGTNRSLKVAAVLRQGLADDIVHVTARNAGGAVLTESIDVQLLPGTDRAAALTALRAATRGLRADVAVPADLSAAAEGRQNRHARTGMLFILGVSLLYCAIVIAATLVMAAADRIREQGVLRLAGATSGQVLRVVAGESLLAVGVGTVLAAFASLASLGGLWAAIRAVTGEGPGVALPWPAVGGVFALCVMIAVSASLLPACAGLRTPAIDAAGARE